MFISFCVLRGATGAFEHQPGFQKGAAPVKLKLNGSITFVPEVALFTSIVQAAEGCPGLKWQFIVKLNQHEKLTPTRCQLMLASQCIVPKEGGVFTFKQK